MLTFALGWDEFHQLWRFGDWNDFAVRIVGEKPVVTTSINGTRVAEIDLGTLECPNYDADAVAALLGRCGHIGLEVHDNDARFGEHHWGRHAACRWRNIPAVREL